MAAVLQHPSAVIPAAELLARRPARLFSCGPADGTRLPRPAGPAHVAAASAHSARGVPPLAWSHIAVGMMLVRGGRRATLEARLLERARTTWMAQVPQLEMLLLVSCVNAQGEGAARAPKPAAGPTEWLHTFISSQGVPSQVRWRCYLGNDRLGRSLWRKTAALFQQLIQEFPGKEFYLKMDSDAMMFPRPLIRFLEFIRTSTPPGFPLYFGNNRIADRSKFCLFKSCLLRSEPWLALARNQTSLAGDAVPQRLHGEASYAQGGFYGLNRIAIELMNQGACMDSVATAVDRHRKGVQLFEDETVGLCMYLHNVPLVTCSCFYDWGPCDIGNTSSCRADTSETKLCRLPLSVHKLKELSWYDGWWRFLSEREGEGLRELDEWESSQRQHATQKKSVRLARAHGLALGAQVQMHEHSYANGRHYSSRGMAIQ